MAIELFMGTYNKLGLLPVALACLRSQTAPSFSVTVLDEHPDHLARPFLEAMPDPRFTYQSVPPHQPGWHYHAYQEAFWASDAEWVGCVADDSYYAPVYLERLAEAGKHGDLVACDWVYGRRRYQPMSCGFRAGQIDLYGFLVRPSVFRAVGGFPDRMNTADGHFVERVVAQGYRCHALRQTLFVKI